MKRIVGCEYENGMYVRITVDGILDDNTNPDELVNFERIRHGHWIDDGVWDVCSVCGLSFLKVHINGNPTFNYCPNCGAKMNEISE